LQVAIRNVDNWQTTTIHFYTLQEDLISLKECDGSTSQMPSVNQEMPHKQTFYGLLLEQHYQQPP